MDRNISTPIVLLTFVILFLAFSAASAQPTGTAGPSAQAISESGTFSDGVYSNRLLKMKMSIPAGWTLVSDDVNKAALKDGFKDVREADRKHDLTESEANTRILFQALSPGYGEAGHVDVLGGGIEVLSFEQSQEQYAIFNRDLVLKTLSAKVTRDLHDRTVGGVRFTTFTIDAVSNGVPIQQTYLITRQPQFFLFFVVTTNKESVNGARVADAALETMRFTK